MKFGLKLIDAGTAGYFGQSYSSSRFKTSCHNCSNVTNDNKNDNGNKNQNDNSNENNNNNENNNDNKSKYQGFAVCTIRSRPQRTIHCAIYARNFYN